MSLNMCIFTVPNPTHTYIPSAADSIFSVSTIFNDGFVLDADLDVLRFWFFTSTMHTYKQQLFDVQHKTLSGSAERCWTRFYFVYICTYDDDDADHEMRERISQKWQQWF